MRHCCAVSSFDYIEMRKDALHFYRFFHNEGKNTIFITRLNEI